MKHMAQMKKIPAITLAAFAVLACAISVFADKKPARTAPAANSKSAARPCNCTESSKIKKPVARRGKKTAQVPCQPRGYVDPAISKNLNSAVKEMKRAGIKPVITSAYRSSEKQAAMHRCSNSARCRILHPGLYRAKAPGTSLHEAGFAVDIAGIAAGPRGAKRLTPRGARIVKIMRKNGFSWRYGLADPVHFEADPRQHGYKSAKQAIGVNQNRCRVRLVAPSKSRPKVIAKNKSPRR